MVDFILRLKGDKPDNVRTAIGIIDNAKDLILREELFKELSEKSGIREAVLRGRLKGMNKEQVSAERLLRQKLQGSCTRKFFLAL